MARRWDKPHDLEKWHQGSRIQGVTSEVMGRLHREGTIRGTTRWETGTENWRDEEETDEMDDLGDCDCGPADPVGAVAA